MLLLVTMEHSHTIEILRMNVPNRLPRWVLAFLSFRGMFNLNDPRWGRGVTTGGRTSSARIRIIGPTPPPTTTAAWKA